MIRMVHVCAVVACLVLPLAARGAAEYREELIFPLNPQHNHAPGIVECPGGELLVSW